MNMKTINFILFILSIALILFCIGWDLKLYFENWKYVLSPFGKLMVYWKPDLLLFVGVIGAGLTIKKL